LNCSSKPNHGFVGQSTADRGALTCAAVASSVVAGIAAIAISQLACATAAVGTVATGIAVADIVVTKCIVAAAETMMIGRAIGSFRVHHPIDPFAGSRPSAGPEFSFSSPSSAYEYQNRAYCGIP